MPRSFGFDKPFWGMVEPRDRALQTPARNHMVAASGEFAGTFMFLLFAYLVHSMAVSQASDQGLNGKASSQTVVFISLGYGFPLLVAVWTLFRVSGGLFNPAVTFGLCISGKLPWTRGLIFLPVQILGGICAAAVTAAIIPGDIANTQTTLAPKVSIAQGLFIEMVCRIACVMPSTMVTDDGLLQFLTAELTFTVLMLAVEKSKGTFIAPIGVGLALFIAQLAGVYYTGASLNPVRSFGPCVAAANFQGYHWSKCSSPNPSTCCPR